MLGADPFTFPAVLTQPGIGRNIADNSAKTDDVEHPVLPVVGKKCGVVVERKTLRNVHSRRTGHTITAAGTVHFH